MRIEGPSRFAFKSFWKFFECLFKFISAIIIRYLTIYLFIYFICLLNHIVGFCNLFNQFETLWHHGGKLFCPGWSLFNILWFTFVDLIFCSLSVRVEINSCFIFILNKDLLLNAIAVFLYCFLLSVLPAIWMPAAWLCLFKSEKFQMRGIFRPDHWVKMFVKSTECGSRRCLLRWVSFSSIGLFWTNPFTFNFLKQVETFLIISAQKCWKW